MSTTTTTTTLVEPSGAVQPFSRPQFLKEYFALCDKMNAPYDRAVVEKLLTTFDDMLSDSVVILRCTSKEGDPINWRNFTRRRLDTIAIATKAGLLKPNDPLGVYSTKWSTLDNGKSEQWNDYDPIKGLAKTWVHFHRLMPVEDILGIPELNDSVKAHLPALQALQMTAVPFTAVDYGGSTMNIYAFMQPDQVTKESVTNLVKLAGTTVTDEEYELIKKCSPKATGFAVTINTETGDIPRVAFYLIEQPKPPFPEERITKFFENAPNHDPERGIICSWSFGKGKNKYTKLESSYVGDMRGHFDECFNMWIGATDRYP